MLMGNKWYQKAHPSTLPHIAPAHPVLPARSHGITHSIIHTIIIPNFNIK